MAWQPRFLIEKVVRKQSLAEHSYLVAVYVNLLADYIEWSGDRGALLQYALHHDLDELVTGDWPTPIKRFIKKNHPEAWAGLGQWVDSHINQKLPWLSRVPPEPEISFLVSVADTLEAILYLTEEAAIGNSLVSGVKGYLEEILRERTNPRLNKAIPQSLRKKLSFIDAFVNYAILGGDLGNVTVR